MGKIKLPPIRNVGVNFINDTDYECPHCGRHQVINGLSCDYGAASISVRQCLSCNEIRIDARTQRYNSAGADEIANYRLFPAKRERPAKVFEHSPGEVVGAYEEACRLFGVHVGAAGAYARRALELILDRAGYKKPTLAASIDAASKEQDTEKKLPKRLLSKLDYVKEIGNFALHVRRGNDLTIVEIDADEVEACLEIVEELVTYMFEEPGRDYIRTTALNEKLRAAGKKEISASLGAYVTSSEDESETAAADLGAGATPV